MGPKTSLGLLACAALLACGGEISGVDGGTPGPDGSAGGPDAVSTADAPFFHQDAMSTSEVGPPGVVCDMLPSSGLTGDGGCEVEFIENCSDGTSYQADCSCPAGTCTCTEMSAMSGSGGGGIPFTGCPSCNAPAAWEACGFPQ